jgi:hypothetical protein
MTTTLEHKPKSVVTRNATVTETPAKLYPCRDKLTKLLAEHSDITNVISEFESKLARAELDLNKSIDEDDDTGIDRFQGQVSVYGVKLSAKKSVLAKLVGQLPSAISAGANEYSTLLLSERERRVNALSERVAEVLQADADRLINGHYLDDVIDESGPVKEIDRLRFSCHLVGVTDGAVLSTAKHLLTCYDEILRAAKETI